MYNLDNMGAQALHKERCFYYWLMAHDSLPWNYLLYKNSNKYKKNVWKLEQNGEVENVENKVFRQGSSRTLLSSR